MAESPQTDTDEDNWETEFADTLRDIWVALVQATRSLENLPNLSGVYSDAIRELAASEHGLTPTQLGERLHIPRSTVSDLIAKLEGDGYAERHPSPRDKRSVVVVCTPAAYEIHRLFDSGRATILRAAIDTLPARDSRRLLASVRVLKQLPETIADTAATLERAEAV